MKDCPLCILEKKTKWFYKDDKVIICNCLSCGTPMLVLREHGRVPSPSERAELIKLCEKVFGRKIKLRGRMFSLSSHWHDHILI